MLTLRAAPDADPLTTRAAPMGEATTLDEKTRSIEYTLLTENMATVYAPEIDEVVDEVVIAAGVEWPDSVRLLADHIKYDIEKVRGSVREFRREGSEIVGRAYFAEDSDSEKAWIKVKGGHLPNISAGYRVLDAEYLNPGETKVVAGRSFTARARTMRIATRVMMREDSLVAVPADIFATTRTAPQPSTTNRGAAAPEDSMKKKFRAWLTAKGKNPDALTETERAALLEQYVTERKAAGDSSADGEGESDTERAAARQQAAPAPVNDPVAMKAAADAAAAAALVTERARIAAIEDLGANDPAMADTVRQAIREGWDTVRATAEILKKTREARSTPAGSPAIHVVEGVTAEALGGMLTMRSGVDISRVGRTDTERAANAIIAEKASRYRQMSLLDVCRACLRLDGKQVPFSDDDTIRAAVSGGTLLSLFTTSAQARVLQAFVEAGDSTAGLCNEDDVPNFKTNDRIRAGEVGNLKRLPRGGKAKHTDMSDSNVGYKIARFAEQMVFDEQDIIDDNFGVLTGQAVQLGNAAKRLRPDLVYSILMENPLHDVDSIAIFDAATHANLGTGGGSVLSAASLQTAIVAIAAQKGVRAEVILNLMAKTLVVPPALKFTAATLLKSSEVREGRGGSATSAQGTYNALQDEGLTMRSEQRIASGFNNPVTGAAIAGSATRWFLFGDPAACPTIEVGYLRGSGRAPVVRSWAREQGTWGIGFDVKFDIGAKAIDYKNMYRSNGA